MHTANQPYNVLDGADKQKNPRSAEDLARLNRYSSVLRSYCAAGDPVCAGGSVVADHLNYFEKYTDDASSWVISKINGAAPVCGATSSATPTASATASSITTVATPSGGASTTAPATSPVASAPPASSAKPAPFPTPIHYEESCVIVYDVKYAYV